MLRSLFHSIKNLAQLRYTPSDPRASDLYLVEHPKSGITWLSTILANAALIHSGMEQRATFYNVSQYIPDVHFSKRKIGERAYRLPMFRMIKSHAEYNPYYGHVIYLVRHPVSVMTSYFTFLAQHNLQFKDVDSFLDHKVYGLQGWKRHINSWLKTDNQAARLHLVRYEDLLSDTCAEIKHLNENIGLGFNMTEIEEAVQLSDSEKMKASENIYSGSNPRYRLSFVKGERFKLPSQAVDRINLECESELTLLGYTAASHIE